MKNSITKKLTLISAFAVSALVTPVFAQAGSSNSSGSGSSSSSSRDSGNSSSSSATAPSAGSSSSSMGSMSNVLSGSVGSKSDKSLTVDGKTVAISSSTSITKSGQPIKADEIKVGDKVSVSTSTGADGKQQAVAIVVTPGT